MIKKLVISLITLCICTSLWTQTAKRIYIGLDDHTDYMWSADEETYRKVFLETLDYYIKLNDSTETAPYPFQSKWNCDGSYWVYTYQKYKSQQAFNKLVSQIKKGQITVPLNSLINLMGVAPAEATIRDMYYAGKLNREYGLDLKLVLNMEDQVLPLGLSSLWAGAGAAYSWKGICACATKVKSLINRPNQMYWYKGLDDQKVLMKWYSPHPVFANRKGSIYTHLLGTYLEAHVVESGIEDCISLMQDSIRYPYDIAAAFGKGGDDLKTLTTEFLTAARKYTTKNHEIIVSNEIDFFKDFEQRYGANLPAETVTYGNEWGNSIASLAEVSASVKRSMEKLRAAEALYTMVALKDKSFAQELIEERETAWFASGLYFEHDWTADGDDITRKQRADWQRKIAGQLSSYVDTLFQKSLTRLGHLIPKSQSKFETFFVYNPLGWVRSEYSDYLYSGDPNVIVFDKSSGKQVPFQLIEKKGKSFLRIQADNIPSLGYKVYEIWKSENTKPSSSGQFFNASDSTVETPFYHISINQQGAITSLRHKASGREFVKPMDNIFLNDLGPGKGMPIAPVKVLSTGAVSITIEASSYKPLKHTSRITLFAKDERIEIENYITQNLDEKPVTYSFSLNFSKPKIWHEEAGAILQASAKSKGGHYADSMARVDWLTLNHFADISDGEFGMTLSNRDAYFMKTGRSTATHLDDSTSMINVLAAGQIDYPKLGIAGQDGDSYFENFFALRPYIGEFKGAESMRFAMQHQNPLVSGRVFGGSGYDPKMFSLFSISDPNVLVWAMKPAEDGIQNGVVMRLWNFTNTDRPVTIEGTYPIVKGSKITHIETGDKPLMPNGGKLNFSAGHNRLESLRLFLKN